MLTQSLTNLQILPIKWRREHAESILEHYWATVTASQRREVLNPSHHNEQKHMNKSMAKQEDTAEFTVCSNQVMLFYSHSKSLVLEQNVHKHFSL